MNKIKLIAFFIVIIPLFITCKKDKEDNNDETVDYIIDHNCTDLAKIPMDYILKARDLKIAYWYGHGGEQIIGGMNGLIEFKGVMFDYSDHLEDSLLYIYSHHLEGVNSLTNPNPEAWDTATRNFLDTNTTINVVVWTWDGQVNDLTSVDINKYLNAMNNLEKDYPNVKFVYFTDRLDGTGLTDNLFMRNDQIRNYCKENKKFLYDFADIESYDPDGNYYGDKLADYVCNYDADGDGILETVPPSEENNWQILPDDGDKNWAIDWQESHMQDVYWYDCYSGQSQALNANQKAYAAWWLWARLAGWDGK
ncbi:hypothetical protein ACFLTE_04985 [Bacteroidota bacterium]